MIKKRDMDHNQSTWPAIDTDLFADHKIMAMAADKRDRLILAAMQEFIKGYRAANTDEITKNAGISKGLLFHYFGSKKGLYLFLLQLAVDTVTREYLKVTLDSHDFLENIRRVSLKAQQLSVQFPVLYQFLAKGYLAQNEVFPEGPPENLRNGFEEMMAQVYRNSDSSLFRDDIDIDKARKVVIWTIRGFSESLVVYGAELVDYQARYAQIEAELEAYLALLRKTLYRPDSTQER